MARLKSNDEFEKEVVGLVGEDYSFLEEYVGSKHKMKVVHNTCGNLFYIAPNNFLRGARCPVCAIEKRAKKRTKTHDWFVNKVFELVADEYEIIDEYEKSHTKHKMKHNTCGYEYYVSPQKFLTGRRCPKCAGLQKKTQKQFVSEVENVYGEEYEVLGNYKNSNTRIEVKHNVCGNVRNVFPSVFLSKKQSCNYCDNFNRRKTTEEFSKQVFGLVGEEYSVLSDYKNTHTKVLIRHNDEDCNNYEWYVTPNHFLNSHVRCPSCGNFSKGEKIIENLFVENNINHKAQYSFDNLKLKNALRFDFAIFDINNKLIFLLEYDGEQHYRPVKFGGMSEEQARTNFKLTKKRDKIKNQYCKANNIKLIRIPYWDFSNLEEIILDLLNKEVINIEQSNKHEDKQNVC